MELHSITQLLPNRVTHLVADSIGNFYWIQETDEGQDIVFVLGQDGITHATTLTSAAVLSATHIDRSVPQPNPSSRPVESGGNIQSIAVAPDGTIAFYFNGGVGRETRVCLGNFDPRSGAIHILADAAQLADRTGMGPSLSLARGKLIVPRDQPDGQPPRMWLWIRHTDSSSLFRFDPRPRSDAQPAELVGLFASPHGPGAELSLLQPTLDLCAGPSQSLLLLDSRASSLWRADEDGNTQRVCSLIGLTTTVSDPSPLPDGAILLFAADTDPAVGVDKTDNSANLRDAVVFKVKFPALIVVVDGRVIPIVSAEDIQAPDGVDRKKLRLTSLLPAVNGKWWVGYDAGSGQLMRMLLSPRD